MGACPRDIALPVINRLEDLACNLDYTTAKKSIALFASPDTQKILYLDEVREEQIHVNSGFRIRDLTLPGPAQYYLLLLSGRLSKVYQGDSHQLQLLDSKVFQDDQPCNREAHKKGDPCVKPCLRKQNLLDRFLHHIDEKLAITLDINPLPVFVLASAPVAEHFARITRNDWYIGAYIHEHRVEASEADLLDLLQPYLRDWPRVRQQMALQHITTAEASGKLDYGFDTVSRTLQKGNSRLLVIERGFTLPSGAPSTEFFIHDPVDALIEKMIDHGGQVEWVSQGQLPNQAHIALIRYY
jgi:hypothetical protein